MYLCVYMMGNSCDNETQKVKSYIAVLKTLSFKTRNTLLCTLQEGLSMTWQIRDLVCIWVNAVLVISRFTISRF